MVDCVIFLGQRRITAGPLASAVRAARERLDGGVIADLLVFDAATSRAIDIDWRGPADAVVARLLPGSSSGGLVARGRPRLGVVAREITLLPRHWTWLARQPGGASAALRRLIDIASSADEAEDSRRRAQESAHRFLTAMATTLNGFDEALRCLFAGDRRGFQACTASWPEDIRTHGAELAAAAFAPPDELPAPRQRR